MRLAFFAPVSPKRSGIADYVEGLLPSLVQRLDITVVLDDGYRPSHAMFAAKATPRIPWIDYATFLNNPDAFDLVIYQMGNECGIHGYMFDALRRFPGLLCLHDLVLHHAIAGLTLHRGKPEAYIDEMCYSYGTRGKALAESVIHGEDPGVIDRYPLIERVLDNSLAVVAFNPYMGQQIHKLRPELPLYHIPLHLYHPDGVDENPDTTELRRELDLEGRPVIATLGLYNPNNRLDVALQAFRRIADRYPDAVYLLVGALHDRQALLDRIGALGLTEQVRLTGWVSVADFWRYMHLPDIAIQLRYPHAGGTCYPPIRLMGAGVPTIISDIEPLADIPDDAVVRIAPNEPGEVEALAAAMDRLLGDADARATLAATAQSYARRVHGLDAIVEGYVRCVEEVLARRADLLAAVDARRQAPPLVHDPHAGLIRVVGCALAELGVSTNATELLRPLARSIKEIVG